MIKDNVIFCSSILLEENIFLKIKKRIIFLESFFYLFVT